MTFCAISFKTNIFYKTWHILGGNNNLVTYMYTLHTKCLFLLVCIQYCCGYISMHAMILKLFVQSHSKFVISWCHLQCLQVSLLNLNCIEVFTFTVHIKMIFLFSDLFVDEYMLCFIMIYFQLCSGLKKP